MSIRFDAEYPEGKCYSRKKAGQEHEFRAKYTVIFINKRVLESLASLLGSRTPPPGLGL